MFLRANRKVSLKRLERNATVCASISNINVQLSKNTWESSRILKLSHTRQRRKKRKKIIARERLYCCAGFSGQQKGFIAWLRSFPRLLKKSLTHNCLLQAPLARAHGASINGTFLKRLGVHRSETVLY